MAGGLKFAMSLDMVCSTNVTLDSSAAIRRHTLAPFECALRRGVSTDDSSDMWAMIAFMASMKEGAKPDGKIEGRGDTRPRFRARQDLVRLRMRGSPWAGGTGARVDRCPWQGQGLTEGRKTQGFTILKEAMAARDIPTTIQLMIFR
jgi:hypothetical protein